MAIFAKKKKIYELEDADSIAVSERDRAIEALEVRRLEICQELEDIMRDYAKLTKKPKLAKRKYKRNAPNEWEKPKLP